MTRRMFLVPAPDPDRDLPDPGHERPRPTCRDCGEPRESDLLDWCDRCYWGPVDGDEEDDE